MAMTIKKILKKCSIYLDDSLISKEQLLERYLSFFAETLSGEKPPIGFALHTGSVCFDALSIAAAGLGCLSYIVTTIDDVIAALRDGDYVIYEGQRYRWKGIQHIDGIRLFGLAQDGTQKKGALTRWLPYHENRHGIQPYYGTAQATNAVGIKPAAKQRADFLAYLLDCPAREIPPEIDVAVVIACARDTFSEQYRRIHIEYGNGLRISLAELLTASYYTDTDRPYQIGENPTKTEPVLKVTGNLSVARELIYDRSGNRTVGFLSLLDAPSPADIEDLSDILRAPTLQYAYIAAPISSKSLCPMIEQHTDAAVIACTKQYLAQNLGRICSPNQYTKALFQQAETLRKNRITPRIVENGISQATHNDIRSRLDTVRSSHWNAPEKDTFLAAAYGLLNLYTTAVFTMEEMESAISGGIISLTSPRDRIRTLWDIANQIDTDQNTQDQCAHIADALEQLYDALYMYAPKREELRACLERCCPVYLRTRLAIIVPKAYYAQILTYHHRRIFTHNDISCVTPARFDPAGGYTVVISVGELKNKKYNPSACLSAAEIDTILAPCEERFFTYRQRAAERYERLLDARMGIAAQAPPAGAEADNFSDEELRYFTSPETDLSDFKVSMLRSYTAVSGSDSQTAVTDAVHIGRFTSGAQILFSRYYTAVVFDPIHASIMEKKAGDLVPGDTLVFTRKNNATKNIVDLIYEELLQAALLEEDAAHLLAKSLYWKTVLRAYKERKGLRYSDLTKRLAANGILLRETSIRQWLSEDAHIIGPQKLSTLAGIAAMTQDPFLRADVQGYFDACARIRATRRKILTHIAVAINAQLSGTPASSGAVLSIVADHVEKLAETLTLEDVQPLDEPFRAKSSLVNRPITEAEVTL